MQENTGEEILDRGVHFLSLHTLPVILPFYKSILCILKPERVSSLLDPHQDCRASKRLTWLPCFQPHAGSSCAAEFAAAPRGTGSAAAWKSPGLPLTTRYCQTAWEENRAGIRNKHHGKQEAATGLKRQRNRETSPEEFLFCWVHSDQPCIFKGTTTHYFFRYNFGSTAFITRINCIQSCPA